MSMKKAGVMAISNIKADDILETFSGGADIPPSFLTIINCHPLEVLKFEAKLNCEDFVKTLSY